MGIISSIAAYLSMITHHFIRLTLLLAGLFTVFNALSQEYNYIHYDTKDGLAGTTVYDVVQDQDGFIWFATEAGISRFDGTHFKNFGIADGLPETEVLKLFVDSKNRVWMAPFKPTICYYYKGKIYNQDTDPHLKKIRLTNVVSMIMESTDHSIVFLSDGDIVVMRADSTVDIYDGSPTKRYRFWLSPNLHGKGFQMDYNDSCFTLINGKVTNIPWNNPPEMAMLEMHKTLPSTVTMEDYTPLIRHALFASTDDGTWMVDTTNYKRYEELFLKGKRINHVLIDNEKNIWFSTLSEGVYKLASREFKTWFLKSSRTPEIFSISKANGIIYAGSTYSRIYTLKGLVMDTLNYEKEFSHSKNIYSVNRVLNLNRTSKGALIGASDALIISENHGKRVVNFNITATKSIDELEDGTLLVGTSRRTMLVNPNTLLPLDTVFSQRATAVCNYNKQYYIGTLNGLYIVSKNKSIRYMGDAYPPLRQRISYFAKDADGSLWIATYGAGIIHVNSKGIINQITTQQGISSNICRTLFLNNNFLWVGTDKGLNKVNIGQTPYPVTIYSTTDGLPTDIINAVYVDSNKVYVGSPMGLTYFDETKVADYSKCNLRILDISVANQSQPLQNSYRLRHAENSLKISYAGISFKSGGNIWYRYRLKGLSNRWDSTTQNALEYPSLPPGKYQFEIIAINKKGVVSNPEHISFIVEAAFWQTLPFQIGVIAAVILVTWVLVSWRFRKLRKTEQEKMAVQQRLNDLEQMALRAQMNPHFIFNCLNSIQNFIITNNLEASNWYLTEFAHLIRQTLDNSEKSTITITNEIKYLERYLELEMMRFGHSFKYSIELDPAIDRDMISIPTMILQPYIENSIRHGMRYKEKGDGVIQIQFVKNNDDLLCIIQDNGIGRKKANDYKSKVHMQYQSKGMSLTAERINILNRQMTDPIDIEIIDLTNEQNEPAGTKVIIRFPGTSI